MREKSLARMKTREKVYINCLKCNKQLLGTREQTVCNKNCWDILMKRKGFKTNDMLNTFKLGISLRLQEKDILHKSDIVGYDSF